jgi:hypothetical protein
LCVDGETAPIIIFIYGISFLVWALDSPSGQHETPLPRFHSSIYRPGFGRHFVAHAAGNAM